MKYLLRSSCAKIGWPESLIDGILDIATNGEDALEKVVHQTQLNQSYGLIISDCSMPIVDGYQFATRAREHYS